MGTKVGIVYALESGILRRYIYPTDDTELASPFHVGIGEAMLIVDQKVITNPMDVWIELSQHLGKVVPSGKCIVVDKTGQVVDVIMADPAIDQLAGYTLISSDNVKIGATTSDLKIFTNPPEISLGLDKGGSGKITTSIPVSIDTTTDAPILIIGITSAV